VRGASGVWSGGGGGVCGVRCVVGVGLLFLVQWVYQPLTDFFS